MANAIAQHAQQLRTEIAQRAAALIAEGMDDYHAAKLKAARDLGATGRQNLPDNHEIDTALREHHALFASDTQPQALRLMRESALRAMQWLHTFSPWLSGAVLNGTANEFSAISLELVGVDEKAFNLFLLNDDVQYDVREPRHGQHARRASSRDTRDTRNSRNAAPVTYDITFDNIPVEITLFDSHSARQQFFPPDSIRHHRAQFEEANKQFKQK